MLSQLLHTVRDEGLIEKGDRVLVAVSGGPDSTALVHGLRAIAPRLTLELRAVCIDHGLRAESAEEASGVREHLRALGIACDVLRVNVQAARRAHVSLQEAARKARLAGLEEVARRQACTKIALGHTADDQAETVLFRILRGTGIAGLAGIPYRRGIFIRPLLDVRRTQILTFLAKRKIVFVTDPSNADLRYSRARIRHRILPQLRQENPRLVEALLSLARQARRKEGGRAWQRGLPPDLYIPRRAADDVDRLVREARGTRSVAVRGGTLRVSYGVVRWDPSAQMDVGARPSNSEILVPAPGDYEITALGASVLQVGRVPRPDTPTVPESSRNGGGVFDPAKLQWPLLLRRRRPGDRMAPRGGRGAKKLSDLLIDAKVPAPERDALPVLCDGSGVILFVPGLRPSQAGCPDEKTREYVQVRVVR